jgi:uncharacterized protein YegL
MRRLPVFFLLDVSESMAGDPIKQMEGGIATIIKELRKNPYALETVWVSIIAFAGKARRITPLTDLISFYPPQLPLGGGTSLGTALEFLMREMDTELVKTTLETKGDWKPLVFLFTDGVPTDKPDAAIARWKRDYERKCNLISISLNEESDLRHLHQLSGNVIQIKSMDPQSVSAFFSWITASISTSSVSVNERNSDHLEMAHLDERYMSKVEPSAAQSGPAIVDTNVAVFLGKCQRNKAPYLIKYQRTRVPTNIGGMTMETQVYRLAGAYQVNEDYFSMTDDSPTNLSISSSELMGFPFCPCCGNQYGFCTCKCGNIMCTGEEQISVCPWCGTQARFGFAEGHQNINRSRG